MRTNWFLASTLLVAAGCATTQPQQASIAPPIVSQQSEAAQVAESPAAHRVTGADIVGKYPGKVRMAIHEHRADKDWPHWTENGRALFPYADSIPTPVVVCKPLQTTDIALESGETISNVALGDAARWFADPASSGDPSNPTPHVAIKCTEPGIETSLMVYTTKRVYRLNLKSRDAAPIQMVAFYYPEDIIAAMDAADATPMAGAGSVVADQWLPDMTTADMNYQILGGPSVPWRPIRAFSDASHRVFIQMPEDMAWTEAPALAIKSGSGTQMVNFRKRGSYYIVDRLFDQAEMFSGVGRDQDRVIIAHQGN